MKPFIMRGKRFKGEPITHVAVSYLRWMVGCRHENAKEAARELHRRGSVLPEIEISYHAIDRFSQRFLQRWFDYRKDKEGIYSYIHRITKFAWGRIKDYPDKSKITIKGMTFIFERENKWPVLKTIT